MSAIFNRGTLGQVKIPSRECKFTICTDVSCYLLSVVTDKGLFFIN